MGSGVEFSALCRCDCAVPRAVRSVSMLERARPTSSRFASLSLLSSRHSHSRSSTSSGQSRAARSHAASGVVADT
jgi:hypothetical protein